ncbi:MAG: ECF transporter S component [Herbinix sp.]|nr:ECF transporter S component [Herbinix sp.]
MNTTTNFRTARMVQLALFIAIIVLMAFTPLGYINTMGLAITLVGIPVIVGSIILGPVNGAILGGVFGITSFIRCFGMDAFGVLILGINPVKTFLLCMIPRILMGGLTGLLFEGLKKVDKKKNIAYAVASLSGSLFNTVFFMTLLIVFFYNTKEIQDIATNVFHTNNVFTFFIAVAGLNAIVEAIVCLIIGTAVAKALDVYTTKSMLKR